MSVRVIFFALTMVGTPAYSRSLSLPPSTKNEKAPRLYIVIRAAPFIPPPPIHDESLPAPPRTKTPRSVISRTTDTLEAMTPRLALCRSPPLWTFYVHGGGQRKKKLGGMPWCGGTLVVASTSEHSVYINQEGQKKKKNTRGAALAKHADTTLRKLSRKKVLVCC